MQLTWTGHRIICLDAAPEMKLLASVNWDKKKFMKVYNSAKKVLSRAPTEYKTEHNYIAKIFLVMKNQIKFAFPADLLCFLMMSTFFYWPRRDFSRGTIILHGRNQRNMDNNQQTNRNTPPLPTPDPGAVKHP